VIRPPSLLQPNPTQPNPTQPNPVGSAVRESPLRLGGVRVVKENPMFARILVDWCRDNLPTRDLGLSVCCRDALANLRREPVGLLVCGLNLSDFDGLDLIGLVQREKLASAIVVVADRKDERTFDYLVCRRSVDAYLDLASLDQSEFQTALIRVRGGGSYVSNSIKTAGRLCRSGEDCYSVRRTDAEQDILALVGTGLDDESIAGSRFTSAKTVLTQRKQIMKKLNTHSRGALIAYAARRGLVRFCDGRVLRPGFEHRQLAQAAAG